MEDKEREFYQSLITKLFEYNSTLVMRMIGSGQTPPFPPFPPQPQVFSLDLDEMKKLQNSWTDIPISNDFIKDMMRGFFPAKKDDKDKLTK